MKISQILLLLGAIGMQLLWISCQKNSWDDPAGNQKLPEPEAPVVDAAYTNVSDPTIASDGTNYFIISSNASIEGITYQKGLMYRKTTDLVTFEGMSDDNAYVLSDVIDGWAATRIKTLDPSVSDDAIKIGQPCLRHIANEWRLYYTVSAGTKASIIGYATAVSPEGPWQDQGEILSSTPTSTFAAFGPSVCLSTDGTALYMAYGNSGDGIFLTELDLTTNKPKGAAVKAAFRNDAAICQNAELFTYGGYYHLLFTHINGDNNLTCHAESASPLGSYKDFTGRNAAGITDFWNITRVLTDHQLVNSTTWTGISGVGVCQNGDQFYVVHHAKATSTSAPILHIREMHWIEDIRRVNGPNLPVPAISPERFAGVIENNVTAADLTGDWNFGTLWGHVLSGINDPMAFSTGGTYDGGSWDFNSGTHILHLSSTEWGGEQVYLYISKGQDWDKEKAVTLLGSGVNDTFGDHPGDWMKKNSL
ncbi:Glycosyl hydrolases family 43 [bacterium A37T11]|nr:Glycosyl hydrolases family 43 [bacterium A37T11]